METVLITGGTGMIGKALTRELTQKGYQVIILTRNAKGKEGSGGISYAEWNVEKGTMDVEALGRADYLIHLAGASVAEGRWTTERKREIVDSRVLSGQLLARTLQQTPNQVKALVSSSAIGWYGPDPQVPNPRPFVESDPPASDFLGSTCRQWEGAVTEIAGMGKRVVILRTGIVLSREGGAYQEFKKPLNFGVATVLGSGRQVVSWIHIGDLVKLYLKAIEDPTMQGVFNAVAPYPVDNKTLITEMARIRNKPFVTVPVPAFALKLALGEMSIEVLKSATVSAAKVEAAGFHFSHPTISEALQRLQES